MHIVTGFYLREIAGESIAIPSADAAHQLSGLIALNDSGKLLFQLLQSEQTEERLIQALLQQYDTDYETAQKDVQEFLNMLQENHLLVQDSE